MTAKQGKQPKILTSITAEVSRVVIGKDELKELLLTALLSQGHVLIEGLPGTAKTTLARTFARVIGGKFKRVQGTPDMLPADILGFYFYHPDGSSKFMPGPIFANVVLVDELNRTTPRTQSALLEAMQEQQVTIERESHPLEQPFIVIASQIPYGSAGTSPLTEVQTDRFMFRIWSALPGIEEEEQILQDIDAISEPHISSVATPDDITSLQQEVKKVYIADSIRRYIINILDRLRHHQDLLLGPSPRGGIALLKGARALAFIQGRDFVIPDDVKRLLIPALCHRLRITPEAEMENVTPEAIINKTTTEVPIPKEGASQVEVTSSATGEAAEAVTGATPSQTEATGEVDKAAIKAPANAAEETAVDEAQQTTATETKDPPATRSDETSGKAGLPMKIIPDWQWIVITIALVVATVMISVGLMSIR